MSLIEVRLRCLELAISMAQCGFIEYTQIEEYANRFYKFLNLEDSSLIGQLHEPLSIDTRY